MAGKKRNLSKIAGLHTGTDKNGNQFFFGEVNEGSTLLILPNMNGEGDGAGRFDYIAFFAPNNRYEETEANAPANGAAEAKATPPEKPIVQVDPVKSPAKAPVEEKPKIEAAPVTP